MKLKILFAPALSVACVLIFPVVHAAAFSFGDGAGGSPFRVTLNQKGYDPREPGKGDFLDCPSSSGKCDAVLIPRVEADEKVVLPRRKAADDLRFLSLKGYHLSGGDAITTIALFKTPSGDSVFADMNNDEDLGNDGVRFWPNREACLTIDGRGGAHPFTLCRAGDKAKEWRSKCDGLKSRILWAMCGEDPISLRVNDQVYGSFTPNGKSRLIGMADMDGDGRFQLGNGEHGDRILLDWNGDGVLENSLEGDGFVSSAGGHPFRFSVDSATFEVTGADENGGWIELRKITPYDPGAAVFRAVEGRPAPDIKFVNLDGDTMHLSDFKGKKVLVNFWSVLCKPCLDGLQDVREFNAKFGSKNWQVISITTDQELDLVQQASLKHHMDWMVGLAGPETRGYYATRPLPLNIKINEAGILEKKDMPLGKRSFGP